MKTCQEQVKKDQHWLSPSLIQSLPTEPSFSYSLFIPKRQTCHQVLKENRPLSKLGVKGGRGKGLFARLEGIENLHYIPLSLTSHLLNPGPLLWKWKYKFPFGFRSSFLHKQTHTGTHIHSLTHILWGKCKMGELNADQFWAKINQEIQYHTMSQWDCGVQG